MYLITTVASLPQIFQIKCLATMQTIKSQPMVQRNISSPLRQATNQYEEDSKLKLFIFTAIRTTNATTNKRCRKLN
jgi:hypothetical protein